MPIVKEKRYGFRKRMRIVHKKDVRNPALAVNADEYEITNGVTIVLPKDSEEVILCAAKDFLDYLFTSMKVSAMLGYEAAEKSIVLTIDSSIKEDYIITVSNDISIKGKNERALAQALYYLEDKMSVRKAPFIKKEIIKHTFMFSPRMIHSGYALDEFPDEHLSAIAHAGMDSILLFVEGMNLTHTGYTDFNELIARAARYGLDVYAYSCMKSKVHPEDKGAQEFYDNLYGKLFEECPGFRGIILVGESVQFPSKDEHVADIGEARVVDGIPNSKPRPGWWPCYDYPLWLDCVKKAIRKHKADADIVFWTYNWGYVDTEERIKLINALPTDISLMATYEMFETYQLGCFKQTVADYSLAFAGPGHYFSSEAKAAKERGIRLYSMTNTGGLTWDIGTIPYEPMPYQWINRYNGMRDAHDNYGLCGIMESHHYGYWPSFIGDLAKLCFIEENISAEENLTEVIKKHFGDGNTDKIKDAMRLFSDAIRCYTPSDADQYGAFRLGPAYPFCLVKEVKPPSEEYAQAGTRIAEVSYPADYSPTTNIPCGRGMHPALRLKGEIECLNKMLEYMQKGVALLKEISNPNEELLYLINLGEYICCCVVTGINAKDWFIISSRLRIEQDRDEVLKLIEEAKTLLTKERENAENAIEFVENDSRLGWEPTMEYVADVAHIRWKLKHLDYVLNAELKHYINASDARWFE